MGNTADIVDRVVVPFEASDDSGSCVGDIGCSCLPLESTTDRLSRQCMIRFAPHPAARTGKDGWLPGQPSFFLPVEAARLIVVLFFYLNLCGQDDVVRLKPALDLDVGAWFKSPCNLGVRIDFHRVGRTAVSGYYE